MSNSNFNVQNATSECIDLLDKAKNILSDYNKVISLYNKQHNALMKHLNQDKAGNKETLESLEQVLVSTIKPIDYDKAVSDLPEDLVLITYEDLDDKQSEPTVIKMPTITTSQERKLVTEEDEIEELLEDDFVDTDDFNVESGSKARCLKGTGLGNHRNYYTAAHVRRVMDRMN